MASANQSIHSTWAVGRGPNCRLQAPNTRLLSMPASPLACPQLVQHSWGHAPANGWEQQGEEGAGVHHCGAAGGDAGLRPDWRRLRPGQLDQLCADLAGRGPGGAEAVLTGSSDQLGYTGQRRSWSKALPRSTRPSCSKIPCHSPRAAHGVRLSPVGARQLRHSKRRLCCLCLH